jgi:hypothetical protein
MERFGLQIRTSARSGSTGILRSPEATNFGTSNGFSKGGSAVCALGAILTQVYKDGNFYAILFAFRQLKDHEKNYLPFLLEAAATV